jgi:MSHA biogenesis protein MshI
MQMPKLSSLFKSKTRDAGWVAVGVAEHGVYLAQVQFVGARPSVMRCEYHDTGTVTSEVLERVCREAEVGNHAFTTLLAPSEYQIALVEAPNVPVAELKTAIRWKIKDGLNYHIDDATVDVLQIPASRYGSDRPRNLYAITAQNTIIQQRIALFEHAKLQLDVIDIQETAQRNIAALFEQEERALGLLVFDDNGGLLTFTSGGELYLSRRIEIGVGQLLDADERLRGQMRDRVELELQRSLDYFDRQFNYLPLSRVLVCVPEESGLVAFLNGNVEAKVEALDLAQVMDIDAVPALANGEFAAHALATLGAALREESKTL